MTPKLDEIDGCLATGRGDIKARVERLGKKDVTKTALYRQLLRARRWIDRHLADALDVPTLAKLAAISEHHFNRLFKAAFATTPHKYLRERRLAMSRHLLTRTNKAITEIAVEVGFETPSAFTAAFTKMYGQSPSAWRVKK